MFKIPMTRVFETLNTNKNGLTSKEATLRLQKNGKNKLQEQKPKPWIVRFLHKFKDLLILVLLGSATLSVVIALLEKSYMELLNAGIILFVVVINAIIGMLQEDKADKAMQALKNMTKPYAKVIRNGETHKVKTEDIVVGDIVVLEAGDIVPADLRLFESASLQIEESAITGESVATDKNTATLTETNVPLGDQHNMAFMSTVVTYGRGKGVVVATGMQTQMGKIAGVMSATVAPKSPLTKRIDKTSEVITIIVLGISIFVLLAGVLRGEAFSHSFMIAIAIAVGAIPEGLPAAMTITLSLGAEKMSKQNAIIKKLPAVETLGSTQVICSDKTGTLTLNKMTVQQIYISNLSHYEKELETSKTLPKQPFETLQKNKNLQHLLSCMLLCNDTELQYDKDVLSTIGDPTETALVHYGFANNVFKDKLDGAFPRVNEIPFDSKRKRMTTIHANETHLISYTKGAVDSILPKCTHIMDKGVPRPITEKDVQTIYNINTQFASHALRNLAFATKNVPLDTTKFEEENLVFIGLVGLIDPPREEVKQSIRICKSAGIMPIMITGDHKDTAYAIAKELHIASNPSQVITGVELDNLTDDDLLQTVNKYKVYARVNPEHKVRIVTAFKRLDKVVAMTGDGVNDAPSLKSADIGIGMGITGTDVTKGVADMILTDDNFATIVTAVKEGRRVYANILKILEFLLTTGIAEVLLMVTIIAMLGLPLFTPALILYINFVSDTFMALALGTEKAEPNVMKQKPTRENGNLLFSKTGFNVLYMSIIQSIIIFSLYFIAKDVWMLSSEVVVTMSFITLVVMELFHAYNLRSDSQSLFSLGIFTNKSLNWAFLGSFVLTAIIVLLPIGGLHSVMGIVNITPTQWVISIGFAFLIVPAVEFIKLGVRMVSNKKERGAHHAES